MLQFSFSNLDVIPASVKLKRLNRETLEKRAERKNHSSDAMVIKPTEKCSLVEFLGELEAAGYEMVDELYEERVNANDPRGKRTYHMMRYLFARREFMELSDEFKKVRDVIRAELRSICENAMWRVRSFSNPFYKNDKKIPNQRAVSINLEMRQPFFRSDGHPVMVWQKDKSGKRVGDAPLPLKADYCLRIMNNVISLMTA